MAVLIDTNVLLRSVQPAHSHHQVALRAVESLLAGTESICIAIQNVAEFWNAATRPLAHNGLGMSVKQAIEEVEQLERFFQILSESAESYSVWRELLITYHVSGTQVHDTRLAAVMKVNAVERILTFNVSDFSRYVGITALHPEQI